MNLDPNSVYHCPERSKLKKVLGALWSAIASQNTYYWAGCSKGLLQVGFMQLYFYCCENDS